MVTKRRGAKVKSFRTPGAQIAFRHQELRELLQPGSGAALVSSDYSSDSFAGVVIARLQIPNSSEAD